MALECCNLSWQIWMSNISFVFRKYGLVHNSQLFRFIPTCPASPGGHEGKEDDGHQRVQDRYEGVHEGGGVEATGRRHSYTDSQQGSS